MKPRGTLAIVRSWAGLAAASVVVVSAAWLVGEYVHAVRVAPAEKALVESLKERARTDVSIHAALLQPEYDRQRLALERRVNAYRMGGLLLLVSFAVFLAWVKWLRPGPGNWVGIPAWLLRHIESVFAPHDVAAAPASTIAKRKVKKVVRAALPPDGRTPAVQRPGDPSRQALGSKAAGAAPAPVEIRIGAGSCGVASGAIDVWTALDAAVTAMGGGATIKWVGCSGFCHHEPLVEVVENGRRALYGRVRPGDARQLVRRHVSPRGIARNVRETFKDLRARVRDEAAWTPVSERAVDATPWLDRQVRIVLENCGQVDPLSLEDYRRRDGCRALEKCLTRLSPANVLDEVRAAGLRARRGTGAQVADAWESVRPMGGSAKYIVCNADEGDPRASMARTVLEGDPFRVVEGLVIAAYAAGAGEGILHVRGADRVALDRARAAVRSAEQEGLLGEGILGTGFSFRLEIIESASSACGDEAALIRTIEAQRGAPESSRPDGARVEPGEQAALVTDVETVAALPWVLRRGPEAFAALGTERSKGTRVLSLTGKITREGLVEVPMGTTIREVVQDIGGGIPGHRSFKAVLAGGPFGVCIPAALADTRVGDEFLSPERGIVGSGGLVILDDADCIVEIVRRSLRSTQKDYCRTCTLCRVDTGRMLEILERICKGTGGPGDLDALETLGLRIRAEASCGPGRAAPDLVLTTLASFRDEYEAHIRERRCPAAACRALVHYRVLDSCSGCTLCAQVCPLGAIEARPYQRHDVVDNRCTRCGLCVTACPEQAIEVV